MSDTTTPKPQQNGSAPARAESSKSVAELQADIDAARARLAGTVDELHVRTAPKEIVRREVESAKTKFTEATRTPSGDLRTERVAALAAAAVALIGLGALRRRRG
ncbi:DUF3618 domain-containing protein [Knoellia koreensis]|uniref:DUF3618 domain-containing protein n=1 Tax=Knoellia koreensis TaxID=2730921 RepID=A0A849HDY9_9MICO|nr:DUF3618 domain-containing protein [Knoellia sp. DB2414S]NNM46155.1 DUF3618 domain-containing protein [Knoellia sp. DB2414S]